MHGILYELMKANEKRNEVRSVLVPQYLAWSVSQEELFRNSESEVVQKAPLRKVDGGLDNQKEAQARFWINQLVKKNKCSDIFKHAIVDAEKGLKMFDDKTAKDFLRIKKSRVRKISVIH